MVQHQVLQCYHVRWVDGHHFPVRRAMVFADHPNQFVFQVANGQHHFPPALVLDQKVGREPIKNVSHLIYFLTFSEVTCDNPGAPQNGYAQGSQPYRAGDVVQFNCNPEYMMQGQPIIACQDSGRWSGGLPKCVQACSYPGTVISGRMSSVKFYYAIGESITFTCDAGLVLRGAKMLKCLRNGKWSNAIPTCVHTSDGASN